MLEIDTYTIKEGIMIKKKTSKPNNETKKKLRKAIIMKFDEWIKHINLLFIFYPYFIIKFNI